MPLLQVLAKFIDYLKAASVERTSTDRERLAACRAVPLRDYARSGAQDVVYKDRPLHAHHLKRYANLMAEDLQAVRERRERVTLLSRN